MTRDHQARLLILSGPSGVGKTTLAHALVQRHPKFFQRIITVTTRPPRAGEQSGIDYHFVTEQTFESMVNQGDFLEHALVYGHRYGTRRRSVEQTLQRRSGILIVDVQGYRAVAQEYRDRMASVFLMPLNQEELAERLQKRDDVELSNHTVRLASSQAELAMAAEYDYRIANLDFEQTLDDIEQILVGKFHNARKG